MKLLLASIDQESDARPDSGSTCNLGAVAWGLGVEGVQDSRLQGCVLAVSWESGNLVPTYIYIYLYREREREGERERYIYMYIYIYVYRKFL